MALATRHSTRWLVLSMIGSVICVGGLAYWDEERESASALEDFGQEQATLAASVASDLGDSKGLSVAGPRLETILEIPGTRLFLIAKLDGPELVSSKGLPVHSVVIEHALAQKAQTVRLRRPDASALGLPSRLAVAGIAYFQAERGGPQAVVVVSTALRERDREERARLRLVLAVAIAGGLVLTFGGLALRTQRKELELGHELALAQMTRARDERLDRLSQAATVLTLASGMAHELSTPLGVIVGRAEQLAPRVSGDERAARAVQVIVQQSERIRQVIRGFLDLARGATPELREIAPRDIVTGALALVEHKFSKAGIALATDVAEGLPPIRCEPRLLEHALVNLLLNACDASNRGARVRVSVRTLDESVEFAVTDEGIGIAPGDAARVTEPFFTTKASGTGLGLAVTNEIVKTHRGSLAIGPADPRGTRAAFRVPVAGRPALQTAAMMGEQHGG